MRQKESRSLKLCLDSFGNLSLRRYSYGTNQQPRLSPEFPARRVQKLGIFTRTDGSQKQRSYVHRPVPRSPFQPPQPLRRVLRRRHLPASITPKANDICHLSPSSTSISRHGAALGIPLFSHCP